MTTKYNWFNGVLLISLLFGLMTPTVNAQPSAEVSPAGYCVAEPTAAIPALLPVGNVQYCILLGAAGRVGDTTYIGGKISGPTPLLAAVTTISFFVVGCTAMGAPTVRTNLAALNLAVTSFQPVIITDTTCTGAIRFQVSVGGTAIIDQQFPFSLSVRDDVTAVMSWGCNNTGTTSALFSPSATVCSPVEMSNTLSGAVVICPEAMPCFLQASIDGNITDNSSTNITQNGDFGTAFVNWLPIWFGIVMIFVAIRRQEAVEPNALMFGAVLLTLGAIICPFPGHPHWLNPVGLVLRFAVLGVAIWAGFRYATARKDWNTGEDD